VRWKPAFKDRGWVPCTIASGFVIHARTLFLTACVGLVIGWRWPVVGGAISTGGMLRFAVEFAVTGGFPKGLVFPLMLLPGLLFLLSTFISRPTAAR
jgi:hypothetical protein